MNYSLTKVWNIVSQFNGFKFCPCPVFLDFLLPFLRIWRVKKSRSVPEWKSCNAIEICFLSNECPLKTISENKRYRNSRRRSAWCGALLVSCPVCDSFTDWGVTRPGEEWTVFIKDAIISDVILRNPSGGQVQEI